MQIQIVDNVSRKMASAIAAAIQHSAEIKIAVAFVSRSGLSEIRAPLEAALHRGAQVEFLAGYDMRTTEPQALSELYDLTRRYPTASLYCLASLAPSAIYHPKLYLSRREEEVSAIIGSSNLTAGGLKKNVELNVVIRAGIREEVISDILTTYNLLKFHPKRVIPDEEFLDLYAQLCAGERQHGRARTPTTSKLREAFETKASALRRPQPRRSDLLGWLELVYDHLPAGEFTNQQVYSCEAEFRQQYPGNANIRAKIRQQLQVLRDMGFIEHVGTARWRKV